MRDSSLFEACSRLFADYPLAVSAADPGGDTCSMILTLEDGTQPRFFLLSYDCKEPRVHYRVRPWRSTGSVRIGEDSTDAVPGAAAQAVTSGVPVPRHGSLFGWSSEHVITALIAIDAEYAPSHPQPSWAVMPIADRPESEWPPFTGRQILGQWFWELYRTGRIMCAGSLIAHTRDSVFWVDTKAALGWDSCAVVQDVEGNDGYTLRRGLYAYYQALRTRKPLPPLSVLLAESGKTDMGHLFKID